MPKLKDGEKRIYLKFEREEDLELYERLQADAVKQRYDVQTYILLVLLQAYPDPALEITEERKQELLALANNKPSGTDSLQIHHTTIGASLNPDWPENPLPPQ